MNSSFLNSNKSTDEIFPFIIERRFDTRSTKSDMFRYITLLIFPFTIFTDQMISKFGITISILNTPLGSTFLFFLLTHFPLSISLSMHQYLLINLCRSPGNCLHSHPIAYTELCHTLISNISTILIA